MNGSLLEVLSNIVASSTGNLEDRFRSLWRHLLRGAVIAGLFLTAPETQTVSPL